MQDPAGLARRIRQCFCLVHARVHSKLSLKFGSISCPSDVGAFFSSKGTLAHTLTLHMPRGRRGGNAENSLTTPLRLGGPILGADI
jgi:hypothetical protein